LMQMEDFKKVTQSLPDSEDDEMVELIDVEYDTPETTTSQKRDEDNINANEPATPQKKDNAPKISPNVPQNTPIKANDEKFRKLEMKKIIADLIRKVNSIGKYMKREVEIAIINKVNFEGKELPEKLQKKLLEDWNKAERLIAIKWAIEEGSIDLKEASEIIIPAHDAHVKAGKKSATTKSILQGIAEAKGMPNKKRKYETIEPRDKQETEKRSITTQLSETSPIGKNPLPQRFKGSKSGLLLLPAGLRVISTKIRFALTIRLRNIHEEVYEKVSIGAPLYASYDKNEDKEKIIEKRFISGQLTQLIHDEIMKLNTNDEKTKKENEEKFFGSKFYSF